MGVPEGEESAKGAQSLFKAIMHKNVPNSSERNAHKNSVSKFNKLQTGQTQRDSQQDA